MGVVNLVLTPPLPPDIRHEAAQVSLRVLFSFFSVKSYYPCCITMDTLCSQFIWPRLLKKKKTDACNFYPMDQWLCNSLSQCIDQY